MRLINAHTLLLHEFHGENTPPYAILSHTWGDQEVTFQDWKDQGTAAEKSGFTKVRCACQQALNQGLEWMWIDTNCIDKTSSAELTEAINSMFAYYQQSKVCFAYLSDVPSAKGLDKEFLLWQIRNSRWFTRGWTLQELIAPQHLTFYAADWTRIGRKDESLAELITEVTGIDRVFLNGRKQANRACIAKRMSWLAKRTTTRVEDMAYCVLGIFDINMPLLYGEGPKAFTRLQEEIIKKTNDHTIFCWTWTPSVPRDWASLLAPSPIHFEGAGEFSSDETNSQLDEISIFSMTNAGLSIRLPVMYSVAADRHGRQHHYFVTLLAGPASKALDDPESLCIRVKGKRTGDLFYVCREPYPPRPVTISKKSARLFETRSLLVMDKLPNVQTWIASHFPQGTGHVGHVTFLPIFDTERLQMQLGLTLGGLGEGVLDRHLGAITLEVKAISPNVSVGVGMVYAWVKMASNDALDMTRKPPNASISIGIKVDRDSLHLFSKISRAPHKKPRRQRKALRHLERRLLNSETLSPGSYCEELRISTAIEVTNDVLEPGKNHYFLRVHDGVDLSQSSQIPSQAGLTESTGADKDSDVASNVAVYHRWGHAEGNRIG
ncbi:hypothetical protein FALCPG4_014599 [Fusarium falciforme]